jgi:hypothetical protein
LTQSLQDIVDEDREACQKTNIIVDIHITNEQKYHALELLPKRKEKKKNNCYSKSKEICIWL